MREFNLPDPGEGLLEAEIVHWHVAVGDTVAVNDILVEIETAKSLVELPSPFAGVVAELLFAEGAEVEVGTPIIRIAESAAELSGAAPVTGVVPSVAAAAPGPERSVAAPASASPAVSAAKVRTPEPSEASVPRAHAPEPVAQAEPVQVEVATAPEPGAPVVEGTVHDAAGAAPPAASSALLVGYGAKTGAVSRRPRKAPPATVVPATDQVHGSYDTGTPVSRRTDEVTPSAPVTAQAQGEPLPAPGRPPVKEAGSRPPLAKPPVRRVARDLGVDLNAVLGSGPGGLITNEDVIAAAGSQGRVNAQAPADRRIPLRGVKREMYRSMTASLQIPQATAWVDVDVTNTMALLETLKSRREFANLRLSPLLIFAKAACLAIARNPEINSSIDEEAEEIVLHGDVNLGIAAATPRGLVVPNIKKANRMSLLELAQALNQMVSVAKQGKVQPFDLRQGTFTITNIGIFGIDAGTPILNPGEAAIMCLGTIVRRPWVVGTGENERIEPRSVCTVALTFDHRLVDGEAGSKFLADVATIMADPGLSLLY